MGGGGESSTSFDTSLPVPLTCCAAETHYTFLLEIFSALRRR